LPRASALVASQAARALLLLALTASTAAAQDPSRIVPLPQSSLVLASDGSLIGEIGREWRTSISIRSLPKYLPAAFVAVEDQRFYQHDGVDLIGVAGAVKGRILGANRGGASTITQQLIGNMHPAVIDRRDISLERKLREQMAAREMEKRYSKEQILEAYLNTINFGNGWYGVEAAARHYFGKPAAQLSLAEAASLAALPKSPVGFDPIRNPARNRERRDLILGLMAEQGHITRQAATSARNDPLRVAPNAGMSAPSSYFVDAVRQELQRAGVPVMDGGLTVYTTLDPALQRSAVASFLSGIQAIEARAGYRHPTPGRGGSGGSVLQGALVVLDPATGDVRALIGGRDYSTAPFNRAVLARRQPGSAFKPFVYAEALERELLTGATLTADTAIAIPLSNGRFYRPDNADNAFLGSMTVRESLVRSRNTVAVQMAVEASLDSVTATASRLGISSPLPPFPSTAIGAAAVRPIELAAAYAPFANDGYAVTPRAVTRVVDGSGRNVFTNPAGMQRPVLDARVAFIVRDMLREAVERGTGAPARRGVPADIRMAGKTGTTNDNVDVWFAGMTPELVGVVWLGFDTPRTIAPGAAGGTLAAPIWGRMIAQYYAGRPSGDWQMPEGLEVREVDRATGELATDGTPPDRRAIEYFLSGTEPDRPIWNPFLDPIK
jgi:penicillin-binding protein 2D